MMNDYYDAIYFSPHLDDAALSCGGQIYNLTNNGKTVLIVTIMAGVPADKATSQFVETLHTRWQLQQDAVESRRAEDQAACKILGADWQHWDFLDCIYRVETKSNRPFYTSDSDIFGEIDPAESGLTAQIAERMAQLPPSTHHYLPLTLGHHVDHQLTRLAAEQCFPLTARLYYEDYPYARQISAEKFITNQPGTWQSKVISLTKSNIAARIKAISCFESQLSTFFKDQHDLEMQANDYINAVGGERVWLQTANG